MMFKTHIAFGALFGLLLTYYFQPRQQWLFALLFLLASVLPDIDCAKSKIGRKVRPVSSLIEGVFKHRGFLHTIWLPSAAFLVALFFQQTFIGVAISCGYMLHLFVDALSTEGVRIFYPFLSFRLRGFVRTGSGLEYVMLLLTCIAIGWFVAKIY